MDATPLDQGRQAATALSVGELEELIMTGALLPCPHPPRRLCVVSCAPTSRLTPEPSARSGSFGLGREGLAVGPCVTHGLATFDSGCPDQQVRCCRGTLFLILAEDRSSALEGMVLCALLIVAVH